MNRCDLAVAENECHQNFRVQLSMLETKDVMGQLVPFFFSHSYLSRAILGFIAAYLKAGHLVRDHPNRGKNPISQSDRDTENCLLRVHKDLNN